MDEYAGIEKPTTMDYVHAVVKAGIGSLPVIGSALGEFLNFVVVPAVEIRRTNFMNDLANRLKALEEDGNITFEDLKNNPQFIDTVLIALSAAQRTSEADKHAALRNAVLNTALHICPEKAISEIFLRALNDFTGWHLRVLDLIANPGLWFYCRNIQFEPSAPISVLKMISKAYPELSANQHLLHVIWNDLEKESFHREVGYERELPAGSTLAPLTTQIGNRFLAFIKEP
jgi:hypothetical protein